MKTKASAGIDNFRKRYKRILNKTGKAIEEYNLIEQNDRIMVAVSGGKDSLALLYILSDLQQKAPVDFEIFAYTLDQAQPGFDATDLLQFYKKLEVEYYIETQDTYSIVKEKIPEGQTYCSLCSRLRRGILYSEAERLKATKVALGHHSDDAAETLLMNMFYNGRLAAMAPKLLNDAGTMTIIRPLIKVEENECAWLAERLDFPVMPCNLCNSQSNLQRQRIKKLLQNESDQNPKLRSSIQTAITNVQPRHLADTSLFEF